MHADVIDQYLLVTNTPVSALFLLKNTKKGQYDEEMFDSFCVSIIKFVQIKLQFFNDHILGILIKNVSLGFVHLLKDKYLPVYQYWLFLTP